MAFAEVDRDFDPPESVIGSPDILAQQRDGKFLAYGVISYAEGNALQRLNADGTIDTTFGDDGVIKPPSATSETSSSFANFRAASQLPDGKLLVVAQYTRRDLNAGRTTAERIGVSVSRYRADGTIDPTFGTGGSVGVAFNTRDYGRLMNVQSVGFAPDGSTYVVFQPGNDTSIGEAAYPFRSLLIKFNADGSVDRNWGQSGVLEMPRRDGAGLTSGYVTSIDSIAFRGSDSVLIAGSELHFTRSANLTNPNYSDVTFGKTVGYVSRLTATGETDPRFGDRGSFRTGKVPNSDGFTSELIRPDADRLLLVDRYDGRLRVINLSASGRVLPGQNISRVEGAPADSGLQFDAQLLPSGSILINRNVSFTEHPLVELRQLSNGRWTAQAPKFLASDTGNPLRHERVVVGQDGEGYTFAAEGYTGTQLTRFDLGSGTEPRDDVLLNVAEYAVSSDQSPVYSSSLLQELHVFFRDVNGGLKYRFRDDTGRWGGVETVDAAPGVGYGMSSTGPAVAYSDTTNGDLKFAERREDGTWTVEVASSAGTTGYYPSMVKTSLRGQPTSYAVAYYHRSTGDLRLARRSAAGEWDIETIDRAGDAGRVPRIVERRADQLAIAYAADGQVRLAEEGVGRNGRWGISILGTGAVPPRGIDVDYAPRGVGRTEKTNLDPAVTVAWRDANRGTVVATYRPRLGRPFQTFNAGGYHDPQLTTSYTGFVLDTHDDRGTTKSLSFTYDTNQRVLAEVPERRFIGGGVLLGRVETNFTFEYNRDEYGEGYTNTYTYYDAKFSALNVRDPI